MPAPSGLVDLDLEPKVHSDEGGVVIVLASGTGKADEHPRVVAGPQGPPLELQGEISWGGSRMPKQAKISPGHGFKGSVDEDEAARIIVAGLVSNGRDAPPTQRGAVEEHREARVWRVGRSEERRVGKEGRSRW